MPTYQTKRIKNYYLRAFYEKHPDRKRDYSIRSAVNYLIAEGFSILAADGTQLQHTRRLLTGSDVVADLSPADIYQLAADQKRILAPLPAHRPQQMIYHSPAQILKDGSERGED